MSHPNLLVNKMERTTKLLALSGKILVIVVLAYNVLVKCWHPARKPATSDYILVTNCSWTCFTTRACD